MSYSYQLAAIIVNNNKTRERAIRTFKPTDNNTISALDNAYEWINILAFVGHTDYAVYVTDHRGEWMVFELGDSCTMETAFKWMESELNR